MGVRHVINADLSVGKDNKMDTLLFEGSVAEILDTMDHVHSGSGTLLAGASNVELSLGDVEAGRFLWIEADGEIDVYLNGGTATAASVTGAGANFPTLFAGGETYDVEIDGTLLEVVFDVADQTLAQVVNRINSVAALAGLPTPRAFDVAGQLRINSNTTGSGSTVTDIAGTGIVALGFDGSETSTGVDPVPNTAPLRLKRMTDLSRLTTTAFADNLRAYLIMTVEIARLFVTNASGEDVKYSYAVVGDLSPVVCGC